ncbi:ABC transporter ATP-binding/substrate-binding protein [Gloeomargarita lithophora]|uniref:ABC transporter ATP-binding/substrate-binding protein n=1 Tax=Gloeomargarita lithophora TaxID=1188228 RepID=UPI001C12BB97|nr:nitrate ABC transporter ATP-binding protein [Gloeomargarita lithophora]
MEIDHVDKIFQTNRGTYSALKNIHIEINKGEFIAVIGHSGCGKSTLLNIVAGLDKASAGGIILEGKEIHQPGPNRMVVFQNHSLLPWLTVRQNIALGVNRIFRHRSPQERRAIIDEYLALVHLTAAAGKYPHQISGGMRQRVGIARALALQPKILLLDEPFGALDALTRGRLQEQLMQICNTHQITALMITHDVDEALLLADRVVMLTNGPGAHIGRMMRVELPRPRQRMEVINNPNYYRMRGEIIEFLDQQKKSKKQQELNRISIAISRGNIEKVNLDLGFIPLTDASPLIVAQEQKLFDKYGLEVQLKRQSSWTSLAENVINGALDGAMMVAGMPLVIAAEHHQTIVTAMTLSRNGNAITLSNQFNQLHTSPIDLLREYILQAKEKPIFGIVHPASMQNFLLRKWLIKIGIQPDIDVELVVIPPPQMVANLIAGNIIGFCVGEPWNTRAVLDNVGFIIATDIDLYDGHIEKVLGVNQTWAEQYPYTHLALIRALLEACAWCQQSANREELADILSQPHYLNMNSTYIKPSLCNPLWVTKHDTRYLRQFHHFLVKNEPCITEYQWILEQLIQYQIIDGTCANSQELLTHIIRDDIFQEAIALLDPNCLAGENLSEKI